jgi:hypothetical protein
MNNLSPVVNEKRMNTRSSKYRILRNKNPTQDGLKSILSSRTSFFNLNKTFVNNAHNVSHRLRLDSELSGNFNQASHFEKDKLTSVLETSQISQKPNTFYNKARIYDFENWKVKEKIVNSVNLKSYYEDDEFSLSSNSSFPTSNLKHSNSGSVQPITILFYKYFFNQKLIHRENFIPLYGTNLKQFSKNTNYNYSRIIKYLKSKQSKHLELNGSLDYNQTGGFFEDEKAENRQQINSKLIPIHFS